MALVEHYVCIGAGATLELATAPTADQLGWDRRTYQASRLCEFPPSRPLPSKFALESFCLPSGLKPTTERRPPRFASFVLTLTDGERLYGHCLTVHEPLLSHTTVRLAPGERDGKGTEQGASNGAEPAELSVGQLAGSTTFFAPRCLCLLSRSHYPLALKASLLALHAMCAESAAAPLAVAVETALSHLVLNVPLPVRGGPTVRFRLGPSHPSLHVGCSNPADLPSTDYSISILLNRLSAVRATEFEPAACSWRRPPAHAPVPSSCWQSALLQVFHALLLEAQVVIVSDDDEIRIGACELLIGLLHPLQWAQVGHDRCFTCPAHHSACLPTYLPACQPAH